LLSVDQLLRFIVPAVVAFLMASQISGAGIFRSADAPRQRIAALRFGTGLTGSKR
jgi:hypothetical protein